MRSAVLIAATLLLLTIPSFASDSVNLLVVDRTQSLMESMQVEVLARILLSSEAFTISATTKIPEGPHPRGPFHFVIIIPPGGEWVWVCVPGLPEVLPLELRQALEMVKGAIEEIFVGERQAADPADDLYPFLWSAYFLTLGILEGAQ